MVLQVRNIILTVALLFAGCGGGSKPETNLQGEPVNTKREEPVAGEVAESSPNDPPAGGVAPPHSLYDGVAINPYTRNATPYNRPDLHAPTSGFEPVCRRGGEPGDVLLKVERTPDGTRYTFKVSWKRWPLGASFRARTTANPCLGLDQCGSRIPVGSHKPTGPHVLTGILPNNALGWSILVSVVKPSFGGLSAAWGGDVTPIDFAPIPDGPQPQVSVNPFQKVKQER